MFRSGYPVIPFCLLEQAEREFGCGYQGIWVSGKTQINSKKGSYRISGYPDTHLRLPGCPDNRF